MPSLCDGAKSIGSAYFGMYSRMISNTESVDNIFMFYYIDFLPFEFLMFIIFFIKSARVLFPEPIDPEINIKSGSATLYCGIVYESICSNLDWTAFESTILSWFLFN